MVDNIGSRTNEVKKEQQTKKGFGRGSLIIIGLVAYSATFSLMTNYFLLTPKEKKRNRK